MIQQQIQPLVVDVEGAVVVAGGMQEEDFKARLVRILPTREWIATELDSMHLELWIR